MEAQFPHYDACAVKIEGTAQPSRRMGQRATLCVLHGFNLRSTSFGRQNVIIILSTGQQSVNWTGSTF